MMRMAAGCGLDGDGSLRRCGGLGGAEVQADVRGFRAGYGVDVVVVCNVCASATRSVGLTVAGGAVLASHIEIPSIGLEGALGSTAVDVGHIAPDLAISESVLELRDGGGVGASRLEVQLEGDSTDAWDAIGLVVGASGGDGDLGAFTIGRDRPEVDGSLAVIVDVGHAVGGDTASDE